jgi:hypothetical protein
MAVDPEFLEFMPSTVRFRAPSGRNFSGEATGWGEWTSARARIVMSEKTFSADRTGAARVAVGEATLDDTYELTDQFGLELPDEVPLNGKTAYIVEVTQNFDENGPYNTVIHFGGK